MNTESHSVLHPDQWLESICDRIARQTRWSPIGTRVSVIFDESGDGTLVGHAFYGTVRACSVREDGTPQDLLVELERDLQYVGQHKSGRIHWLVTRPCLRWRSTNCMLVGWAAVRVIDAPSFVDATYDRTLATGRMYLS